MVVWYQAQRVGCRLAASIAVDKTSLLGRERMFVKAVTDAVRFNAVVVNAS